MILMIYTNVCIKNCDLYNLVRLLVDDEIISSTSANLNQCKRKRTKLKLPGILSSENESDTESTEKPCEKRNFHRLKQGNYHPKRT